MLQCRQKGGSGLGNERFLLLGWRAEILLHCTKNILSFIRPMVRMYGWFCYVSDKMKKKYLFLLV
jgi:hypothetical protein